MYRVDRNNFYKREKVATVFTPDYVSQFLFSILQPHVPRSGVIFDPCVGRGSLLKPWQADGYRTVGVDIEHQGYPQTIVRNYLELGRKDIRGDVALVIMNPPFNIDRKTKAYITKHYGGRPLLPEIWFRKAISLFGPQTPIAMFTPYGFRLNQTEHSARWQRFMRAEYPPISSIVSLPKDVFPNVLFHSEVLLFNTPQLNGHYFVERKTSPSFLYGTERRLAA